eukprot:TRINITY_DN5710_c0_g2_i1.p1 TRINITY_DN5710_c0_g2~~TRINITY_DN5710_c0_g2_i1.p1  ORF type:complete len:673 (+),score=276.56 TRINITY_DN5710_c0_g2_i1:72-2090(+)
MGRLDDDIEALQDGLPGYVSWVEREGDSIEVYLDNNSNDPFNLMLPEGYDATYPKGVVSCVIGCNFEELGEGTIAELLARLNERAALLTLPRQPTTLSQEEEDSDGMPRDESMLSEPEEPMHSQLVSDIQSVKNRYTPDSILVEEMKLLDKVFVTLKLDLSYLSAAVCTAWGLAPKSQQKPVCIKLQFSRSGYIDTAVQAKVNCYQEGREWCGLAGQLDCIISFMLETITRQRADDMQDGISQNARTLMNMGFARDAAEGALRQTSDIHGALAKLGGSQAAAPRGVSSPPKKKASVSSKESASKLELCDDKKDKKRIPPNLHGLLVQILDYAHFRVKTCPEFCVICDQAHMFTTSMLKATVCSREVCAFAFQKLGVGAKAAKDLATDSGVVDLLVLMARQAALSGRWKIIFNPYPTIFDPNDPKKKILHPDAKNIDKVRKIFEAFPSVKDMYTNQSTEERMEKNSTWAYPLLQWILSSNTSHLVKLRKEQRIQSVTTPHQYLLVSAAPSKQEQFDALKRKYKTTFAYHGSATENWHSILRNGLYSASGTEFQVNGAAYGSGIYLSPNAQVSLGYSQLSAVADDATAKQRAKAMETDNPHALFIGKSPGCMAICEVIDHDIKKSGDIWVQPHPDHVLTRFFVVFDEKFPPTETLHTQEAKFSKELRQVVDQFK